MKAFKNLSLALLVVTAVPGMMNASATEMTYSDSTFGQSLPLVKPVDVVLRKEHVSYSGGPGTGFKRTEHPDGLQLTLAELIEAGEGNTEQLNKIKWVLRFGLDFYEASYAASLLNNVRTSFPEGKAIAIIRVPVPDKELWNNKSHHEYYAIEMIREEYKIFKSVSKPFVDAL